MGWPAFQDYLNRIRNSRRNFALLAGLILCLDILLILFFPYPENTYFYTRDTGNWSQEDWAQDRELFWMPKDRFKPQLKQIENSKAKKMIWMFGGSILTPHLANTCFPEQLQNCHGDEYRVVNFGTGGYSSYQSLILLERMLKKGKPELVICSNAYNDRSLAPATDRQMILRNNMWSTAAMFYLRKSRIVSLWWRILENLTGTYEFTPDDRSKFVRRAEPDEYEGNLAQMVRITSEKGIPLLFVTQASSDKAQAKTIAPYFARMKQQATTNPHVSFLDVRPEFEQVFNESYGEVPESYVGIKSNLLFVDLCHYNDRGHKIVGRKVCEFIRNSVPTF